MLRLRKDAGFALLEGVRGKITSPKPRGRVSRAGLGRKRGFRRGWRWSKGDHVMRAAASAANSHRTGLPLRRRNTCLVVAGAISRGVLTRAATGRVVVRTRR